MKRIVASKLDSMSQDMYSIRDCIETIESNVNNLKAAIGTWENKGFPIV